MPVKLNSTGGGSVTLTTPSTASDFTQTLPAGNGTILTTAGVTTPVEFAAGTAALPSITTTGDTNTGAFFPAADTVAIGTGGTERMRVDSSGNVGIGTSSPGAKLTTNQSSTTAYAAIFNTPTVGLTAGNYVNMAYFANGRSTNNDGLRIVNLRDSTGSGVGNWETESYRIRRSVDQNDGSTGVQEEIVFGNNLLAFNTAASERMRIDSSGNVGIGTSSPSTGIANRVIAINGTDAGIHFLTSGTDTSRIYCSPGEFRFHAVTAIPQVFYTNNTERMRINSSGYVSIGSTTTNGLLTVDGLGPQLTSQDFAYYAQSGGATATGYASSQTIYNSIWASSRVSAEEFNARSDGRLKKDVTPIPAADAWQFIQNVPAVHYKWINGSDDGHKFGFIAQDVVKAGFPNLVGQYADSNVQEVTDADGLTSPAGIALTVNYDQIVPVLASALRDALAQIDDLKARLTALEAN